MNRIHCVLGCAVATLLLAASAARAGSFRGDDATGAPHFEVGLESAATALWLQDSSYDVTVGGVVAQVHVTQTYANGSTTPIDARYVFPMSHRAAVFAMTMRVGKRTVVATIEERAAAEKIYEAARSEGKTASLLNQERANVFDMHVANIAPGDAVVVELDYVELLVPNDAIYEVVVPAAVGPRFDSGGATWVQPAHSGMGAATWHVQVHLDTGIPVHALRSLSHALATHANDDGMLDVTFAAERPDRTRDFVLQYRLAEDAVHAGVLRFRGADANYFMAIIQPPARIAPAVILSREYVFIVDVSGSMNGFPIETSKTLVRNLIDGLRPTDAFNILTFAGGSESLAPASLLATPANRQRAKAFLASFEGEGSTELLPALEAAFALPTPTPFARSFVIATDGFVTVEDRAFDLVRQRLGQASVFAFGIGGQVNRLLIDGLARAGGGEAFVVDQPTQAAEAAAAFRTYIAAPVLTDVHASFSGFEVYDAEPPVEALPAVYAARPLVWFGKYRGDGPGTLTLRGRSATGPWSQAIALEAVPATKHHPALATLWARERIARLSDRQVETPEAKVEVTRLGLAYHLMTRHTSFVAVQHGTYADGSPGELRLPMRGPAALPAPGPGNGLPGDLDGDGILDVDDDCPEDARNQCRMRVSGHCELSILDVIYFAPSSAVIGVKVPSQILDEVASILLRNPWVLLVELQGHTSSDERPRFAAQRAAAVRDYLVRAGVDPKRLVIQDYGPKRPVDTNLNANGRKKNRRVGFQILDPSSDNCRP